MWRRSAVFVAAVMGAVVGLGSGAARAEDSPLPGDLIVTEIMQNPSMVSDTAGEWFEVYNATATTLDLAGLTIRDWGTDSFSIGAPVYVSPGEYFVFGREGNPGLNGGLTVDYVFTGMNLGNSDDELEIVNGGGVVIDTVVWDGGPDFPDPNGASMSLDAGILDDLLNDDGLSWCEASSAFGMGDLGTPGAANDSCTPVDPDDDGDGWTVGEGDCDDVDPAVNPGAAEACDGIDNDCDFVIDEGCVIDPDDDEDGFTVGAGDCDDADPTIHPGATEACDGIDNNCDAVVDEGCAPCTVNATGPADGSDLTAQARFFFDGDCDGYVVQLSTDPTFPDWKTYWFGSFGDGPGAQSYTLGASLWSALGRQFVSGGYWRLVGAVDGDTADSTVRSFYTTLAPLAPPAPPGATCSPSLNAPADGAIVGDNSPAWDWDDACDYSRIEFSADPLFPLDATYYFGPLGTSNYRIGDTLWSSLKARFAGGAYWRVVGGAADGGHASPSRFFIYEPTPAE